MSDSEKPTLKKIDFSKYNASKYEDKYLDKYEMPILKTVKFEENLKLVVYKGKDDKPQYDIRYYNENTGRHTIRGVRLRSKHLCMLLEVFQDLEAPLIDELINSSEKKQE